MTNHSVEFLYIQSPHRSSEETEIRILERELDRAYAQKDEHALIRILSDDFTGVVGNVILPKQRYIDWWMSGESNLRSIQSYPSKIKPQGDIVMVEGLIHTEEEREGVPFQTKAQYLRVYVRGNEGWKLVVSQTVPK